MRAAEKRAKEVFDLMKATKVAYTYADVIDCLPFSQQEAQRALLLLKRNGLVIELEQKRWTYFRTKAKDYKWAGVEWHDLNTDTPRCAACGAVLKED